MREYRHSKFFYIVFFLCDDILIISFFFQLLDRASLGALTESTLRPDDYGLQIFEDWNQRWFTELHGDRHRRSAKTEPDTVSET